MGNRLGKGLYLSNTCYTKNDDMRQILIEIKYFLLKNFFLQRKMNFYIF